MTDSNQEASDAPALTPEEAEARRKLSLATMDDILENQGFLGLAFIQSTDGK